MYMYYFFEEARAMSASRAAAYACVTYDFMTRGRIHLIRPHARARCGAVRCGAGR